MEKVDLKKEFKSLFTAPTGEFQLIELPRLLFIKIDGQGDPNVSDAYGQALAWLYATAYGMKFAAKAAVGKDFVVPPLEGLWWAEDPASFIARRKSEWFWTMMIMMPDFLDHQLFEAAAEKVAKKLGLRPSSLRLEHLEEGSCLQALHIGSYDDEAPLLARLHDEIMPSKRLAFAGPHHEVYLSDPRKTEPARLKTILRQPVKPA